MPEAAHAYPVRSGWSSLVAHGCFLFLFGAIVFASHASFNNLPYFWDELGQFVPAALDIYKDGAFIPKSTLPNVHPPGVMTYLAGFWRLFGYSVETTRVAMLALASAGMLFTFMLAVQLCGTLRGLPAFTAVLLLASSPLFYTQAMLAQLDMPAMVFTVLALALFLKGRFATAAVACTLLVLMKETAITTPAVFGAWLLWERRWREACYFIAPAIALGLWLAYLEAGTGHIFGNREFTHYNIAFQLHPVRLVMTLVRRVFYLFLDNFHWIATLALIAAWRKTDIFRSRAWAITAAVFLAQTLVVTVLGGAALERYLMPVLPFFYIAAAAAFTTLKDPVRRAAPLCMATGLLVSLLIPSFFPYPYENNLAVVDFVKLQEDAADLVESQYPESTIASAWPFPDALRRPEFGYVSKPMTVRGLDNFDPATVLKLKGEDVDVLVLYSRTWEPKWGVIGMDWVQQFLSKYYFYQPQITGDQVEAELGMSRVGRFERRGQWAEVWVRSRLPNLMIL